MTGHAERICGCYVYYDNSDIVTEGEETIHIGTMIRHKTIKTNNQKSASKKEIEIYI